MKYKTKQAKVANIHSMSNQCNMLVHVRLCINARIYYIRITGRLTCLLQCDIQINQTACRFQNNILL